MEFAEELPFAFQNEELDSPAEDEIVEIEGEVEQVVSVAGVRGAEAEDEALEHLYYRKSMKGLSTIELQKALGKLLKKKSITEDPIALQKINGYINQIQKKLKK